MTQIDVFIDDEHGPELAGAANVTRLRGVDSTEFRYGDRFLAGRPWELSPDLSINGGRIIIEGLPGALDDSAPDAWGRALITRRNAALARDAGAVAPTLTEVDYLLGVNDFTRQGALRYQVDGSPFLAEGSEVPRVIALDELLAAAQRVDVDDVTGDDAVAALLAAGSGSLGGARPKASVQDDAGNLFVAKFPQDTDRWDVIRWEAVALDLADACELPTPTRTLIEVDGRHVLKLARFDRNGTNRVPYLSARSLVGARDGTNADYLEIAEAITDHGSAVAADLIELWRRIAFSVAINNTDDHLRNHGFLRSDGGWTLSPLFDVNPDRAHDAPRQTALGGATRALDTHVALIETASHFGLDSSAAERLWNRTLDAISVWRDVAEGYGIADAEIDTFEPALGRWHAC